VERGVLSGSTRANDIGSELQRDRAVPSLGGRWHGSLCDLLESKDREEFAQGTHPITFSHIGTSIHSSHVS
jgi:hypothetical protein